MEFPPSRDEFQVMEARNLPQVFPGILWQWPAFQLWNPAAGGLEHLKEIAGESLVQAMVSDNGSTFFGDIRSHDRVVLPFKDYVDMVLSPGEQDSHFYLAQVPVRVKDSAENPPLASLEPEISVPEFLEGDAISNINLWMSSTTSRSSIHYDPYHNVLGVVTGQKKVTLWPPDAAPYLYPKALYGEASNHSEVNFIAPDYEKHPRFREASEHSRTLIVEAGDAVFIPEGWFHQVDSAALTIAINFWWPSKLSCALDSHMDAYYLRRILVSLLDSEKRVMLAWNPRMDEDNDEQEVLDVALSALTPLETKELHSILSSVAAAVEKGKGFGSADHDPIASVFSSASPRSLRRVLLVMVSKFPRSLEALVVHALSPIAAELLTRQFELMDKTFSDFTQAEFYKRFYGVFEDSSVAMAALLDRKEEFSSKALSSVMERFLNCKLA